LARSNYPYQIWEDFAGPGIDDWLAVVQTRRIAAIICGHTHYWQVANDGRNVVVATRSIGDPEGGPPGYIIAYLHGDDLALTYRSIEDHGPVVLVTLPRDALLATGPQHVIAGPDQIRVQTWSSSETSHARVMIDGGDWFPLHSSDKCEWQTSLPGDRLTKGEHTLAVELFDECGRMNGQQLSFMVDQTRRYTAVPSARPRVTQTAFCRRSHARLEYRGPVQTVR
jgi:Icc protein